jgi:hypothetical protein
VRARPCRVLGGRQVSAELDEKLCELIKYGDWADRPTYTQIHDLVRKASDIGHAAGARDMRERCELVVEGHKPTVRARIGFMAEAERLVWKFDEVVEDIRALPLFEET